MRANIGHQAWESEGNCPRLFSWLPVEWGGAGAGPCSKRHLTESPLGWSPQQEPIPDVPLVASLSSLLPHSCFMRSPPNKPPAPMCSAQPGFSEHTNGDKRFYKNSFPGEGHTPHNNHSDFLLSRQVVAYEWQMALAMRAFEKFQDRQWHF